MVDNRTTAPGGFNYTGLRDNTVIPLLAKFGKTGVLDIPGGAGVEPWDPPLPASQLSVTVVQTEFSIRDRALTLVEENDVMFLASTDGVSSDPELADKLTVDGQLYQVVGIRPLKPGPTAMLWKIHARS